MSNPSYKKNEGLMNSEPLLKVDNLSKIYTKGIFKKRVVFQLEAEILIQKPTIVGMMGPNGSGKSTLLELIAGQNIPTSGEVTCVGRNIHNIKYNERQHLVTHHYPGNLIRKYKKNKLNYFLKPAGNPDRKIYLYDELDMDDGFIGFLLNYFNKLRQKGYLIIICSHPSKPFHLEIMRRICGHFIFVRNGSLTQTQDFETFMNLEEVNDYLGSLATEKPGNVLSHKKLSN